MSVVTYTAVSKVATGHIAGTAYYLEFFASKLDDQSKVVSKKSRSIGGNTQEIVDRIEEVYSLSTTPLPYSTLEFWNEFRWSVVGSVGFQIDLNPAATNAVPVNVQSCLAEKMPTIERLSKDFFRINFSVRII